MKRLISDNYVTGDNIYLRELQNIFFEVLGMMSITHYGAIGDGRRDNYGPLQVAIDDANRRGLSFLYVPYGKFIYTGELQNLIDPDTGEQRIIFMGNPHAKIVNIRTGQEIEIHQFGWFNGDGDYYTKTESDGRYVNIAGDTMTGPLAIGENATASGENSFAVGFGSTASNKEAAAIGWFATASGRASFAAGHNTTASGSSSFATGGATASGSYSFATGGATASGFHSFAAGGATASGNSSFANGVKATAQGYCQLVGGFWNIPNGEPGALNSAQDLMILGNGTAPTNLSNAFKVTQGGEGWFSGDVYVGSTSGKNKDEGSKKLISEADLQAFATLNNLQMPS